MIFIQKQCFAFRTETEPTDAADFSLQKEPPRPRPPFDRQAPKNGQLIKVPTLWCEWNEHNRFNEPSFPCGGLIVLTDRTVPFFVVAKYLFNEQMLHRLWCGEQFGSNGIHIFVECRV